MAKFKKEYNRRQDFRQWCDHWFTNGKYIRKSDWKPCLPSICELKDEVDFKDLEELTGNAMKFMYPDVCFTGVCVNSELVHIKESQIQKGKWVMDDPLDDIWKT